MIRLNQIKINTNIKDQDKALGSKLLKMLKLKDLPEYTIVRKSIDARKKPELFFVYSVDIDLDEKKLGSEAKKKLKISPYDDISYKWPEGKAGKNVGEGLTRPVIVGMGPAGLMCAYMLAKAGLNPIICDRGKPLDKRDQDVNKFWEAGILDPESNVQFGEGGAGAFSDGKLNTLINDKTGRSFLVLKTFVEAGAPAHIMYDAKPHLGTDVLKKTVAGIRESIIKMGGTVHYGYRLTDLKTYSGYVTAVFNDDIRINTDSLVLAIGHSARDTFKMLYDIGVPMTSKAFAVGLRVIHPQSLINRSQYGIDSPDKNIGAAPYKLSYKTSSGRDVYSFCMCPGGYVVNASSVPGHTAVNGMSYSGRSGEYANSGMITGVGPKDWGSDDIFAGLKYQEELEKKAYMLGNGNIPVQSLKAFRSGKNDVDPIDAAPFKGSIIGSELFRLMSDDINIAFIEAMDRFGNIINGFNDDSVILAGIESRTSSPVRIIREADHRSPAGNIYPCGEGAGYAGGIMSAAMDGIATAEEIWKKHLI